jgi:hypothetical protein
LLQKGKKLVGEVILPAGLTGTFIWEGNTLTLEDGTNKIDFVKK